MEVTTYSPYAKVYRTATNTAKHVYDDTPVGRIVLYYSYKTIIGYIVGGVGAVTTRLYSVSTSKHQTFAGGDIFRETGMLPVRMEHATLLRELDRVLHQAGINATTA